MKRLIAFMLFIILIFLISGCGGKAATVHKAQASQYKNSSVELPKEVKSININIDSGSLQIFCWDKQEIKFEVKHTARDNRTDEELEKLLKRYSIDSGIKDGTFVLSVDYDGKIKNPKDFFSDVKLTVPRKIKNIALTQDTGDFTLEDRFQGNITAELGSVNSEIKDMEGKLDLKCRKGNVRLNSGKLSDGSGVAVNSGNIYVKTECHNMSKYSFQTQTGNVELNFPVSSAILLDAFGSVQNNQFEGVDGDILINAGTKAGKISVNGY